MPEGLTLEICMWFGSINEETYIHGCDRARPLSIRKMSGDWDDPTGLELSPVGWSSRLGLSVCVTVREKNIFHLSPQWGGVGLFYRPKRPTRTW